MQKTLTQVQKDILRFCYDATALPIMVEKAHSDASPKDKVQAAEDLVGMGMLTKDYFMTNRGVAHLVVEGGSPFHELLKGHEADWTSVAADLAYRRKVLGSDEFMSVYFYYFFKKHIELDMFKGPNHEFRVLPPGKEQRKFEVDMLRQLVEDGRIPLSNVMEMFGVPAEMVKSDRLTKDTVLEYIRYIQKFG